MNQFDSGDSPENEFFRLIAHSMKNLAIKHMREHKWYKSKEAGFDLGMKALDDWEEEYWWCFTRYRRIEHVEGLQCWIEFNGIDFAIAKNVKAYRELLDEILAKMKKHTKRNPAENHNIIDWAIANPEICFEHVFQFLLVININEARIKLPEQWKYEAMAA